MPGFLRPSLWNSHINSAASYWSVRVTRIGQLQGVSKQSAPLDGRNCKVTLQRTWIQREVENWGQTEISLSIIYFFKSKEK